MMVIRFAHEELLREELLREMHRRELFSPQG